MVTWKHIIEGAYTLIDDESDIGKLIHDFNCTQASDMVFPLMAEKTKYLKENPKGVSEVCKQMEDLRNESLIVEDKDEGGFVVSFPELPGCITCGETVESAAANISDKMQYFTCSRRPFKSVCGSRCSKNGN